MLEKYWGLVDREERVMSTQKLCRQNLPPPYVAPRQNPSGHICMDTAMSEAWRQGLTKINRVNRQRENGLLVIKEERNPLQAEATPRQLWKIGYDFRVPAPPEEKPKWTYPESDWGLMSKFESQKEIYDEIFDKQANYHVEIKKFKKMKEDNEERIKNELKELHRREAIKPTYSVLSDPDAVDIRSNGSNNDMYDAMNTFRSSNHTSRTATTDQRKEIKKKAQKVCGLHEVHRIYKLLYPYI